jgi:hypothetical protein
MLVLAEDDLKDTMCLNAIGVEKLAQTRNHHLEPGE